MHHLTDHTYSFITSQTNPHTSTTSLCANKNRCLSIEKIYELKNKLIRCRFEPQEGRNIIQQLITLGTPLSTIKSCISKARKTMKRKGWLPKHQAMSESLYMTRKAGKTKIVTPKDQLSIIKNRIRNGEITTDQVIPFRSIILDSGANKKYISKLFSMCKSKIRSSNKSKLEKQELLETIEISYRKIKSQLSTQEPSSNTEEANNLYSDIITTKKNSNFTVTETNITIQKEQTHSSHCYEHIDIETDIIDDFLDICDTTQDLPNLLDLNLLSFLDHGLSNNTTKQKTQSIAHSPTVTFDTTLKPTDIDLKYIQSGHLSPIDLFESIKHLLKTVHPNELLQALSLYEINHGYDPEAVSESIASSARLIREDKEYNNIYSEPIETNPITSKESSNFIVAETSSTILEQQTNSSHCSEYFDMEPYINDDFLDICTTTKDIPNLSDPNLLSFLDDVSSSNTTKQETLSTSYSPTVTLDTILKSGEFDLKNTQNGHLSHVDLGESIQPPIKTIHTNELFETLSLYEINLLYDLECASEPIYSSAQLIREHKKPNSTSLEPIIIETNPIIAEGSSNVVFAETTSTIQDKQIHTSHCYKHLGIDTDISEDFLNIFDTTKDMPNLLDLNLLSFMDHDQSINTTKQKTLPILYSQTEPFDPRLKTEELDLENIQNGHISHIYLFESIQHLLKTIHPNELLEALSLYEINHLYDPESASEQIALSAQLIKEHKESNKDR